jgi:hypothetical protein
MRERDSAMGSILVDALRMIRRRGFLQGLKPKVLRRLRGDSKSPPPEEKGKSAR